MVDGPRFDERGLIPAVVQDRHGRVLMLAYMNRESLERTLQTGQTWFYSRSRGRLWHKGETSGHVQRVVSVRADCDGDALLLTVDQEGVACHEGHYSCFHYDLRGALVETAEESAPQPPHPIQVLAEVERVLLERRRDRPAGSYSAGLFTRAPDAICKKVGEEATEVVLASKNGDLDNLAHEVADLWFHTLALLVHHEVPLAEIARRLRDRRGQRPASPGDSGPG